MLNEAPRHPEDRRRGLILVLSSPSGAGKTTIARNLLKTEEIALSISVTTRQRRPSEADHADYHFLTVKQFEAMRDGGELLEWAEVHGNFYGTPREPVEQALASGSDILFDIDWQGTEQVVGQMGKDVVTIFVLPPSIDELIARLERRAEDSPEIIARRLENARSEIARWADYDYVIVNRDIERSVVTVRAILRAERHRRSRSEGIEGLVSELTKAI